MVPQRQASGHSLTVCAKSPMQAMTNEASPIIGVRGQEAAEKALFSGKKSEKHTSGAKAQRFFCCIYGTTKVVP
jgi:hypothetical protein